MCVCFAMLGVPLGSASLTGGGVLGGLKDLLSSLHHYITSPDGVHVFVCVWVWVGVRGGGCVVMHS